ncbi:hypothetical protein SAMN05446935_7682 [Burkholderia sp. YR290]|nr:hypothetical protein SAMN05446935_7682 [Burkholderia sp. YR290]
MLESCNTGDAVPITPPCVRGERSRRVTGGRKDRHDYCGEPGCDEMLGPRAVALLDLSSSDNTKWPFHSDICSFDLDGPTVCNGSLCKALHSDPYA